MGRAESRPRERQSRRLSFGLRRVAGASSLPFLSRLTRAAARAALAVSVLAGAAGLAAPAVAEVLVSNDGQTAASHLLLGADAWAVSFETGDNSAGYNLTSIEVRLTSIPTLSNGAPYDHSKFIATIWSVNAQGRPDTFQHELTTPATLSVGLNAFTASSVVLIKETTYAVVIRDDTDGVVRGGAGRARRVGLVHLPGGVQRADREQLPGPARPEFPGHRRAGDAGAPGGRAQRPVEIRIDPDSHADVRIALPARACAEAGAVCTGDDDPRPLSNSPSATVRAQGALSVADATVREGPGATVDFTVSLSRAASGTVTVDYATSNATATAGEDYTGASGTLRFGSGQTSRTISVPVLDDAHDEGEESFTLTLSNASGARIADASATGTIVNTDPMPQAWLARFGRASADHVVEAIAGRWRDGEQQTPQTHFTLGGRQVQGLDRLFGGGDALGAALNPTPADTPNPALMDENAWARMDRLKALAGPAGGSPAGSSPAGGKLTGDSAAGHSPPAGSSLAGGSPIGGSLTGNSSARHSPARSALLNSLGLPTGDLRDVLMGSSFFYSRPQEGHGGASEPPGWLGQWSAWGETAATRFSGADGQLSLDGEVATAILGADSRRGRWLAGVTLSHSEGDGAYTQPEAAGGAVSSRLTSLNPYVHYRVNERTNLWGVLGYGAGGLKLTPEGTQAGIETDLATAMAAFGGRGVLSVRSGRAGALELAVVSDALMTNTVSESTGNLMGAAGQTGRLRLMLEGSGSMPLGTGGVLRPTLEAGVVGQIIPLTHRAFWSDYLLGETTDVVE